MTCPACGAARLPGKRYCHGCGTELGPSCPSCGGEIEPQYRFCPDCGTALAGTEREPPSRQAAVAAQPSPIAGERKQVTVMFCDLVDSTAIAERMDPEEYRELLDRYLALALTEIEQLGGLVNQLAGDGFMALFGAPVAREDAPQAAVRAALAIHGGLAELHDLAAPRLLARIGIHTGPAVVGTVGTDHKMDYTAIGDTTNLAARLQAAAEGGTTLVSEATYRLVQARFDVEPLGSFEVRGRSEPIRGYRVLGLSAIATPMALAEARGLTPFTGRAAELAQLEACFQRLGEQLSQLVSVIGEAGSGKSRLVHEFKRKLASRDVAIFEGRASTLTQSVPFAPILELMRSFFAIAPGDDPETICARIAEKVRPFDPELSEMHPPLCALLAERGRGTEDEPLRSRAFAAASRLVDALAQRGPVVLLLEDLHWADAASLEVLEEMAGGLDRLPALLVVTHRPELRPTWRVPIPWTQLHLRRLPDDEIVRIVRAVAGAPLPPELEARIGQRTEGNPFYAEEITRSLLEDGSLRRQGERLELAGPMERVAIPETVQEVLEARLDRLPPHEKRTAQVAAVFGRQFRPAELRKLLEPEGVDVTGALESLIARGVIHATSPGVLRFGESLTQAVAYESLLHRERRRLHGRIAAAIEADSIALDVERAGLLAHHVARSDDRSRGLASLVALAREIEELPSYPTARELYREAWELGEAMLRDEEGDTDAARRWALDAALGFARVTVLYDTPRAEDRRAAERARELAERIGDATARASALTYEGLILTGTDASRFREGTELIERGVEVARANANRVTVLGIERGLAWIYMMDGRFAESEFGLERVLRQLELEGFADPPSNLWLSARTFRGTLHYFQDRIDTAIDLTSQTYELSVRARNRTIRGLTAAWLARMRFVRGDYDEARSWAERALELGREIGAAATSRAGATVLVGARLARGEEPSVRELRREFEAGIARGDLALSSQLLAEVLCDAGMLDLAQPQIEQAAATASGRLHQLFAQLGLGELERVRGAEHLAAAALAFSRSAQIASELGSQAGAMLAQLGAGRVAHARGEHDAARSLLHRAAAEADRLGLRHYRARATALL